MCYKHFNQSPSKGIFWRHLSPQDILLAQFWFTFQHWHFLMLPYILERQEDMWCTLVQQMFLPFNEISPPTVFQLPWYSWVSLLLLLGLVILGVCLFIYTFLQPTHWCHLRFHTCLGILMLWYFDLESLLVIWFMIKWFIIPGTFFSMSVFWQILW